MGWPWSNHTFNHQTWGYHGEYIPGSTAENGDIMGNPVWFMRDPQLQRGQHQLLGSIRGVFMGIQRESMLRTTLIIPDANHGAGIFTYKTVPFLGFLCR